MSQTDVRRQGRPEGKLIKGKGKDKVRGNGKKDEAVLAREEEERAALRRLSQEEGADVADFFALLLGDGRLAPGDHGLSLDDRPSWIDYEKIRQGQQFCQKYFCGLMLAEMLSLFLLFASPGSLRTLIFSGNSDTPEKAFRRYLSTVRRVRAWYTLDLWDEASEARRHLRTVRSMHDTYRQRLNALRDADAQRELQRRTRLQPPLLGGGAADNVRKDFARAAGPSLCPASSVAMEEWVNQMEMSITQWGFFGLMLSYPERFGAGGASEKELDAFVHLWRVLGHLLGVEDRFNFCAGGLHAVQKRSQAFLDYFVIPALSLVGEDWEHMSRCVVEGANMYAPPVAFEVSLLYLCETVGARVPEHVRRSLSAPQLRQHRRMVWAMHWLLRVPPLRVFVNYLLNNYIDKAQPGDAPSPKAKVESKRKPATEPKTALADVRSAPSWIYPAVFFFLVAVQISIAVLWATTNRWATA